MKFPPAVRATRPLAQSLVAAALWAAAVLPAGCTSVEPDLYPFTPPPNVPADQLLLDVPQDVVDALASAAVVQTLDLALSGAEEKIGVVQLPAGHTKRILLHEIVTGMTPQEVIWCFLSHPTRVRDQGPPGGHTLLWEPTGLWNADSYWVRFDDTGHAVSAGTY